MLSIMNKNPARRRLLGTETIRSKLLTFWGPVQRRVKSGREGATTNRPVYNLLSDPWRRRRRRRHLYVLQLTGSSELSTIKTDFLNPPEIVTIIIDEVNAGEVRLEFI